MSGRVLIVCAANICRSPYTEFRLRRELRLQDGADLEISSAGVAADPGQPLCEQIRQALRAHGAGRHTDQHRSHLLAADDVAADLILAADRRVLRDALRAFPEIRSRAFTVPHAALLVDLLPDSPADGLSGLTAALHHARELTPVAGHPPPTRRWFGAPARDPQDVPDAHTSRVRHRAVLDVLDPAIERIAAALTAVQT